MTLKSYIWGMRISALFALAAWGMVINYIDPQKTGALGQIIFFVSAFLALTGIFTLFFTWLRKKEGLEEDHPAFIGMSFRQGALMAFLVIGLFFLQSMRILVWWDGLLLVAGVFLVELYFLSHKK